jgi:hypothetical protein
VTCRLPMIVRALRRALLLGTAVGLSTGCYEGVEIPLGAGPGADGGIDITAGGGGEDPEDPSDDNPDDDAPAGSDAPAPLLRLLSAQEYENTVRDLLQVEFDNEVTWGDGHTGFDNGSRAQLDESLLALLMLQSEEVAGRYVEQRLALEYPCFSAETLAPDCTEGFIEAFGFRAYRRPLTEADRQTLRDFVAGLQVEAPTGVEVAQWLVTRILASPKFLYRVEGGRLDGDDPSLVDDFDRASLIAYTMTGSMPDAMLFGDAMSGSLDDAKTAEHVRRLAQTPRGQEQLLRFAKQWFRVTALDRMRDLPEEFTKLPTPELGPSLATEFDTFVENTLLGSGTLSDLMLGTTYYVDDQTAPLYGLPAPGGEGMTPTPAPAGRMGVLSLASVLATHASGALVHRDKPIARGMLIKNQLLCEEIGLPSGIDIDTAAEDAGVIEDFDQMTSREQLEAIMNQGEQCVACHQTFMTYGFLSANYDALGQYQTHFGERVLDPRVDDLMLDGQPGNYADIAEFVPALAQSEQLAACYAEQVARFISGSIQSDLTDRLAEDFEGFTADEAMLELFEQMLTHPALYERNPTP